MPKLRPAALIFTALLTGLIALLAKPIASYASRTTLGLVLVAVGVAVVVAASLWLARQVDKGQRG